jgi:hypothetical protein
MHSCWGLRTALLSFEADNRFKRTEMLATHGSLPGNVATIFTSRKGVRRFCGEGNRRECEFCFWFPRLTGTLIALVLSRAAR